MEQQRILFTVVLSISKTRMAAISFVPGLQTRNTIILFLFILLANMI